MDGHHEEAFRRATAWPHLLITHPAPRTRRSCGPSPVTGASEWPTSRAFRSAELRSHLRRSGIEIIGWRPLRELMRDRCCHPSGQEKT